MICMCLCEHLCNCLSVFVLMSGCQPQGMHEPWSALSCPLCLCMSLRHYNNKWLGCNITLQLSLIVVRSIAVQQARQPLACLTGMHGGIIATRVVYLCTQGIQASMARAHCSLFSQPRSRLWLQRLVTSASKCQTSSELSHQLGIQLSSKLSSQSCCQLSSQLKVQL